MNGVICRKLYPFTKDFEWLPDATANTSHNQNDPIVKGSKFSQKGALKQMSISANKSECFDLSVSSALLLAHAFISKELHSIPECIKRI